jgi:hypothetical protein
MTTRAKVRSEKQPPRSSVPKKVERWAGHAIPTPIALEKQNLSTSYGVHVDRERQLAVFTDFWYAVVRYQILKGYSDNGLARDVLCVSDKTVGNWRECIVASGVIEDLIGLINDLPKVQQSRNSQKVRESLQARLDALRKESPAIAATRASGLPTAIRFEKAVEDVTQSVLESLVMDLDARASHLAGSGTPSAKTKAVAQQLAAELIGLYKEGEGFDLPMFRGELESRLAKVSQIAARLSLHQVLGMFDRFNKEDAKLVAALAVAVNEAKAEARSYVDKLFSRMKDEDKFSERASFRARLSTKEPLYRPEARPHPDDPFHPDNLAKAQKAQLDRLFRLIDEHANNTRIDLMP